MKDYKTHKFLKLLRNRNINYHYEGRWLVIEGGDIKLHDNELTSLPDRIKFNNDGLINLLLKSLPDNIEFNNKGSVFLYNNKLTSLSNGVKFNNSGNVDLSRNNLTSLSNNIEFNNDGYVNLEDNKITSLPNNIQFNNSGEIFLDEILTSLPDNIADFYDRLDKFTKKEIKEKFPDHWIHDKIRFGL